MLRLKTQNLFSKKREGRPILKKIKRKKIKRKVIKGFLTLIILCVLGMVSMLIINRHVKSEVKDRILTLEETIGLDVDCVLILGAGIWYNGPSPILKDRLLQGIAIYDSGASKRLLMSGDHGRKEYDEVNVMKQFAMEQGVPSKDIFMDHAGFSTYESIYRARDIFKVDKVIIVTQEYHLYRALYIAKKLGLDAYGVASDPRTYAGQEYREGREILARIKDFFYVIAMPEPTYLGESIPVSGNGDLTND